MSGTSIERTFKVAVWELAKVAKRRKPHGVRWKTAHREHSEWFATKSLADSFRRDLMQAQRRGEEFDVAAGLPLSLLATRNAKSMLDLALAYVDDRWDKSPPNTRRVHVGNLAAIVPTFVKPLDHAPSAAVLQRLLATRLLPPSRRSEALTAEEQAMASWIARASRPVADLFDPKTTRDLLHALGTSPTGRQVTSSTWDTRRSVLHRVVEFAVDSGWVDRNPVSRHRLPIGAVVDAVDPRVVVSPEQARQLLAAVSYVGGRRVSDRDRGRRLVAFFACLYYAGLRPGEAMALRPVDCVLPADGWGELLLPRSMPEVSGKHYSDSGTKHQVRPLKRRRVEDVRPVPIPPVLVAALRDHVAEFGTAADGRLFRGQKTGGGVTGSVYTLVWQEARTLGLTPQQAASPLARRPYDLRHAALSTWLNAGVPPTEVAERAGHSVKVLLGVYAKCLHGQRHAFNARIDELLGE